MTANWLKTRQTKYALYVTIYLAVILGILGAANWLANRHNRSFDATANKRYSLADQTIKIVKNLKSDVKVAYFDRTNGFARARDLLDRYDNLSTRLTVEYVDPDKKPQLARAAGITSLGSIIINSGSKREEAKSLSEEEITSALIRAIKTGERNACFTTGTGGHAIDDTERTGYSAAKELVERNNYKTRSISLLEKAEVPADCTVLILGGSKYDYTDPAVNAIKTYVENGGRALIMLDPPLRVGRADNTGNAPLAKMLEGWGVVVNKDLALDTSGIGQIFGLGPEVPLVTSYESHPIVRESKDVATAFPMSRTLEVKTADKVTVEKLFSTSGNSYATSNLNSAEIRLDPARDKKGPLTLAAAGTYNTGKENNNGRFVVVGSSDWAANNIISFNGNRDLFMNMMNWLSSDEDLISIRPKEPEDRRLSLSRSQMSRIFYSSVIGLPLFVIVSGIMVWWRRR
ncbi:MAG: GldG family protein [Bryobacteraceae bacterium]